MSLVPLDTLKQHLRLDDADEDAILVGYLDGAESAVAGFLCRPLIAAEASPVGKYDLPVTGAVVAAILLMAAHLYANREAVVTGTIATALPLSVSFLLAPYRVWAPDPVAV